MEVESILLAVVHIDTYLSQQLLTSATGFYFRQNDQLFLITNRHVIRDEASGHFPDKIHIILHPNPHNLVEISFYSIPLYGAEHEPV